MVKHLSYFLLAFVFVLATLVVGSVYLRSGETEVVAPKNEEIVFTAEAQEPAKEAVIEVISPDEKLTLIMKNISRKDGTVSQSFSVYTAKDQTETEVFKKISEKDEEIVIPFNTFAPTDKYLFLKVNKPENPEYIVLRTDGEDIRKDEKFVEITGLFYEKYSDLVITDVTGWGGYGLIVLNTDTMEGQTGPSFWFDVTGFSFIRTSTRFN